MHWIKTGFKNGFPIVVCEVCEEAKVVPTEVALGTFVDAHSNHYSQAEGWMGAGDAIHAAAKRLGIMTCTPCEQRRRAMNRMMPRVFKK